MRHGFTLVELAIVLVIIGLIVGAVLTGRDLIKAAEIQSAISEIGGYNAAAVTFRNKFGGLPGDLLAARASRYGLADRAGSIAHGDGNGIIEGCATRESALGCETALFWIDLSSAKLISEDFVIGTSIADGNSLAANLATTDAMEPYLPNLALRDTALVHAFPINDRTHFLIANVYTDASGDIQFFGQGGLAPQEALNMDEKMDDGLPATGILKAISALDANGAGTTLDAGASPAAAGECVNAALSPSKYNVLNDSFAIDLTCNVQLSAGF